MPIYEYRCNACGKRASLFFRSFSTPVEPVCPGCQSQNMERLISKVAVIRTSAQQAERLNDYERQALGSLDDHDQYDPSAIDRWARRVGDQFDGELGTNFKDMAEKMASGDRPYDLYDPRGTFQAALDKHRDELSGSSPQANDPWGGLGASGEGGSQGGSD